ncbi:MAG TPA: hypothetical protein VEU96_13565 [Bryobacteraceae bacterium]|nr:hypothetical protein [Bryobacteraceae bacterium]
MSATLLLGVSLIAGDSAMHTGLVVHEWGTFTSIADPNGNAEEWLPLGGAPDLPAFVYHFNNPGFKAGLRGTVRMETPVLYFYSPQEAEVSVKVDFPHGVVTEWYPAAKVAPLKTWLGDAGNSGRIAWPAVKLLPEGSPSLPEDQRGSHYYTARNTASAEVQIADGDEVQREKFLFYRGVAYIQPPLSVQLLGNRVVVKNRAADRASAVILFENRDGRIGYRVAAASDATLERPELNADIGSVQQVLQGALIAAGLFPDEAQAMLDTWRDSWFEEGTRVVYILPRAAVDSILPLSIDPSPAKIERVFVGRIEIITPELKHAVAEALRTKDQVTLAKYGRFLEPIVRRLR